MKSLKAEGSLLAEPSHQFEVLEADKCWVPFQQKLEEIDQYPLKPDKFQILQINIGKMCNQVCKHCHVDAGPDRKEVMSRETMQLCLQVLQENNSFTVVDLTGGAPEMNPYFRWFVEEIRKLDRHIIVRSNLTIIVANRRYHDLPEFYRDNHIEIVCSLPFYTAERTDRQRGPGVFQDSIKALKMLNTAGYGKDRMLNLVYNPAGAFLPPAQLSLEREYRQVLAEQFGIHFNQLYVITNMPISRYLDYLLTSGNYEKYMEKLIEAFNPAAAFNVMCRNTVSVSWDGFLYDCDFNQMLDLTSAVPAPHIKDFDAEAMVKRDIRVGQHCYGCTAGAGSSCGGAIA
jgi:radical SAM/Cys-rich protein